MKTFFLISLGCPKNLVDSEEIRFNLRQKYKETDDIVNAEIIVINTCAFIKPAIQESIQTILSAGKFKKNGNCKTLIVSGCITSRFKNDLVKLFPEVDLFTNPGSISNICKLISNKESKIDLSPVPYLPSKKTNRKLLSPPHRAYLKIADGCSKNCSYCTIPQIRGRGKSRAIKDIVNEAKSLLENGVKEITLISQDTSAYGSDFKTKTSILDLLDKLSKVANKKSWIRLLYSQPTIHLIDIANFLKSNIGFAPYIDVPIQHVSRNILKSMHRPLNTKDIVYKLREVEGIFLRTTVMTGFPSETKREHNELMNFLNEIKFDHLGAFTFSPEENTKAFHLKHRPRIKTSQKRLDEIMTLQSYISQKKLKKLIGKNLDVLIEEKISKNKFIGRHIGQAPEIDGITTIIGKNLKVGAIKSCQITSTYGSYDLEGKIGKQ